MARKQVLELLEPYCSTSKCVKSKSSDEHELRLLARCMSTVAEERWNDVQQTATSTGRPLLLVHQSDGWGCDINVLDCFSLPHMSCKRVSRKRAEFLLEILMLKSLRLNNTVDQCMRYYAPREMRGKTQWHILGSAMGTECISMGKVIALLSICICRAVYTVAAL